MAIMGIIWWIFGIGWVGASPSWHMVEVVRNGDMATSGLEKATELPNNPLGGTTTAYQFVVASKSAAAIKDYASPIPPDQLAGLTPEEAKARTADWELKNQIVTLSEVAAVDAPLVEGGPCRRPDRYRRLATPVHRAGGRSRGVGHGRC